MNETVKEAAPLPVRSNVGLGIPKFCTVKNRNWIGEIIHGEFDGTYYVLEDGDCYLPETLEHYGDAVCKVEFLHDDPRMPKP
jgi:hypothetical protein